MENKRAWIMRQQRKWRRKLWKPCCRIFLRITEIHPVCMSWQGPAKKQCPAPGRPLRGFWGRMPRRFILPGAVQRRITGRSWGLLRLTRRKGTISLPQRSSIMPCCTPVNIWKRSGEPGLPIWMWMKNSRWKTDLPVEERYLLLPDSGNKRDSDS